MKTKSEDICQLSTPNHAADTQPLPAQPSACVEFGIGEQVALKSSLLLIFTWQESLQLYPVPDLTDPAWMQAPALSSNGDSRNGVKQLRFGWDKESGKL